MYNPAPAPVRPFPLSLYYRPPIANPFQEPFLPLPLFNPRPFIGPETYFNQGQNDRFSNFMYYQPKPMNMFQNMFPSPLSSFNQPLLPPPMFQPSYPLFSGQNSMMNSPIDRSFGFNAFKKNTVQNDNNFLWNPVFDLAHRPLIKQTIYPNSYFNQLRDAPVLIAPRMLSSPSLYTGPMQESQAPLSFNDQKTRDALSYLFNTFKRNRIPRPQALPEPVYS